MECCSVYSTWMLTIAPLNFYKTSTFLQHCESHTGAYICQGSRTNASLARAEGNLHLCVYAIQRISYILRKYKESLSGESFP